MIIGISGKKQSGKDIVGKIIQYLTLNEEFAKTNEDIIADLKYKGYCANKSKFEIKKFADKLKDIVCILIGCTREQLEDETFKNTELGEEWWYFKGRNGSLISYNEDSKRSDEDLIKPTPRLLMQLLGTECGREILHPNIWVNSVFSDYKAYIKDYPHLIKSNGKNLIEGNHYSMGKAILPNWIITDVRFPNEMQAIKDRGGITVRVNRPCDICGGSGYHKMSCPVSKSGEHYSEIALDSAAFDFVINNNKDIEHLVKEVKKILKKLNII